MTSRTLLSRAIIIKYVKYAALTAVLLFCLINVYRSTSQNPLSSHEYLQGGKSADSWDRKNISIWWPVHEEAKVENYIERLSRVNITDPGDFPQYNVTVQGVIVAVPLWQRKLRAETGGWDLTEGSGLTRGWSQKNESRIERIEREDNKFYLLTALLQVRIYEEDKARWTVRELKQWIHFMFLAGVEHIYICDHYMYDSERLDLSLKHYIMLGLVSYLPWGRVRHPMTAQIQCYQHLINRYRTRHVWQIAVDIDEYPFSLHDHEEQFLSRYLLTIPQSVSEVSLKNFLMLGGGDRKTSKTIIQRITRMTHHAANDLVKPVYRPDRVRASVHHNHLLSGTRLEAKNDDIKMLHCWGRRAQQWQDEDTVRVIKQTKPMTMMRSVWSSRLENSLVAFGELDAFSNNTGP